MNSTSYSNPWGKTALQLKDNHHLFPQSNMCTSRLTLKEQKIFTFKEMQAPKACAATSKDPCQWLRLPSSNPPNSNWNPYTPMLSATIYMYTKKLWISHHSMILLISSTRQLYDCITILALCTWIFHMECYSHSTTVLDGRSQTTHPQQCHKFSRHSLIL